MPLYEYQCSSCKHHLEALQKFSDEPLTACPNCHQPHLHKLVSATSFQLKGTGWYATDFRNKSETKAAPETKSETTSSETISDTKKSDTGTSSTDTAA